MPCDLVYVWRRDKYQQSNMRNVLITPAPELKSKLRTKSGCTIWMQTQLAI